MNLTSWIVLVGCLSFGLLTALFAWLTYAYYRNRRHQQRLHQGLMAQARRYADKWMGDRMDEGMDRVEQDWETLPLLRDVLKNQPMPSVPPHPLWAESPTTVAPPSTLEEPRIVQGQSLPADDPYFSKILDKWQRVPTSGDSASSSPYPTGQ